MMKHKVHGRIAHVSIVSLITHVSHVRHTQFSFRDSFQSYKCTGIHKPTSKPRVLPIKMRSRSNARNTKVPVISLLARPPVYAEGDTWDRPQAQTSRCRAVQTMILSYNPGFRPPS